MTSAIALLIRVGKSTISAILGFSFVLFCCKFVTNKLDQATKNVTILSGFNCRAPFRIDSQSFIFIFSSFSFLSFFSSIFGRPCWPDDRIQAFASSMSAYFLKAGAPFIFTGTWLALTRIQCLIYIYNSCIKCTHLLFCFSPV